MSTVAAKLDAARHELLDLGLRNPLLNYRELQARGVGIVAERPSPIYAHLVIHEKPMGFLSTEENGENGLGQPEEAGFAASYDDDQLQTPYSDTELQKRLLTTYYVARDYIEEQGVNVLYLALGMLHWIDRSSSDRVRRAPLVLLPVELFRPDAASRFRLRYTGADWGDNLPLRTKLALDYNIDLPVLPPGNGLDLETFFKQVQQTVASMPDWSVDDTAVSLGFFSFSKFLMYHDLNPVNWSADRLPTIHPILTALLTDDGFTQHQPQLAEDAPIDNHIDLADSHQVIDADSSQTLAILDVHAGNNLVIQGPPGTGKSQTITNLIAEARGKGQTVLFVAEKMAALDVVKRRLDEVGLGDICLELHSHKSTKRHVMTELANTLKLGQPKQDGRFPHLNKLQTVRDHLNSYSQAINQPIGKSETSLYAAYGQQLHLQAQLATTAAPPLAIPQLATWSAAEFEERRAAANALQRSLVQIGVPADHPLWGTQRIAAPDELPVQLTQLAHATLEALRQLLLAAERLADLLATVVPPTLNDLTGMVLDAQLLQTAPRMYDVQTEHEAWQTMPDALLNALKAGERISQAHKTYDQWLIPEAWDQDVMSIRQELMVGRSRWRRLFSSSYRQAKDRLAGLCRAALPPTWEEQIGAVDAILDVQREQPILIEQTAQLQTIFNLDRLGLESEWTKLRWIGEWLVSIHEGIKQNLYPESLLRLVVRGVDKAALAKSGTAVTEAQKQYEAALTALHTHLKFDPVQQRQFTFLPLADQQSWLSGCHAAAGTIGQMAAYNRLTQETESLGLPPLVAIAHTWPAAAAHLTDLLQLARCTALIERAEAELTALQGYDSQHPDDTIAKFCELDSQFLLHNRIRLANEHWQRLPHHEAGGQMGLLQSECDKKRNHLPIRQLMERAGYAVQHIKPVFMMSPLSIAAYLPPDSIQFDLVIFDEASQVRPVDAFGAILRGRQVVVVGDNRQLPPTTFFERLIIEDDTAAPIGQESILDLFVSQNAPQRMLRWHYRSRHESLIAVSNQAFYGQKLVIFPSPDAEKRDVGLRYHHLPHTAYRRGGSRTNPLEADAVAAAVMRHATEQPHLTLGIVAFSQGQRQVLRQRIEQLRRENPAAEPFFRAYPTEPFFVKNLENVQGDERDVILISVGYGRSADGTLTMNFGPLNQDGGERRLNVLITRARQRCEIFTNLTADDIDLRRTNAPGVMALKQFLQFAQTGQMGDLPPETSSIPARFEDVLAAELRAQGYEVAQRVGTGPVRVDVAVLDEENGRYALGIECDGDNYFLARSARDRNRIQGQVLQRLGWRIHRVWSQQWRQNPPAEREKLLAAFRESPTQNDRQSDAPFNIPRYDARPALAEPRSVTSYTRYAEEIDLGKSSFADFYYYSPNRKENQRKLVQWMTEIVRAEGPIHIDEMRRRMSHAAGYQQMTLLDTTAAKIVQDGQKARQIEVRGEFLYGVEGKRPSVRSRANITGVSRRFSYIAPEEIQEAILLVVADALGIPVDDVPLRVARLLGFHQINNTSKTIVLERIERLLEYGALSQYRGELFLDEKSVSHENLVKTV